MKSLLLCFYLLISVVSAGAYTQKYERGYVTVGNDSLYYESAGSGETILFIHDGVLPSAVWDEQFSYFSGNYRVVRYDRRGYGRSSDARGDYSNLEDLVEVFSELGIDRACLVGASSGGALAIDMTLKYPEKVSSLVLVGAVVGGFSYTDHLKTRGGHMPSSFDDDLEQCLYLINDDPYLIYRENITAREKALRILDDFPPHIINGQRIIRAAITPDRRLNEIKVPALILVGEYDLPDVHTCSGFLNAGIADSQRDILSGCGHLIPLEQPEQFNEKVVSFLESKKDMSGGISLRKELEIFSPLVGRIWLSEDTAPDGKTILHHIKRYELIQGGKVIRYYQECQELGVRTDGYIYYNPDTRQIEKLALTSNGNISNGKVDFTDGEIVFSGVVIFRDSKLEYRNCFTVTPDGEINDSYFSLRGEKWQAGHNRVWKAQD